MLIELALVNHDITHKEIQQAVFIGVEKKINVLSVPIVHLGETKQYIDGTKIKLAASLDCPYGQNPTELRQAGIILAERRGASIIELGVNMGWIKDAKLDIIKQDIKTCLEICKQKKLELRLVLEYRVFDDQDEFETYCDLFNRLGITAIISSFGSIPDDPIDNIMLAQKLENRYNYLCSSNLWKPKHIEIANNAKLKRIRFLSTSLLERCIII